MNRRRIDCNEDCIEPISAKKDLKQLRQIEVNEVLLRNFKKLAEYLFLNKILEMTIYSKMYVREHTI